MNAVFACCFRGMCDSSASLLLLAELVKVGVDVNVPATFGNNPSNMTALHMASSTNQIELAAALVRHGADVNAQDGDGQTPILRACQDRHGDIVEMLLDNGGDAGISSNAGCTPLIMLAEPMPEEEEEDWEKGDAKNDWGKDAQLASTFLSAGVAVDVGDEDGMTALMSAARHAHLELATTLLVEGKANVNAMDGNGETAIFYAIQGVCCIREEKPFDAMRVDLATASRSMQTIHLLVQHGANVDDDIKNSDGDSSWELAQKLQRPDIMKLMMRSPLEEALLNCKNEGDERAKAFLAGGESVAASKTCDADKCSKKASNKCSKCKVAVYCSRECQAASWKQHRKLCGKDAVADEDDISSSAYPSDAPCDQHDVQQAQRALNCLSDGSDRQCQVLLARCPDGSPNVFEADGVVAAAERQQPGLWTVLTARIAREAASLAGDAGDTPANPLSSLCVMGVCCKTTMDDRATRGLSIAPVAAVSSVIPERATALFIAGAFLPLLDVLHASIESAHAEVGLSTGNWADGSAPDPIQARSMEEQMMKDMYPRNNAARTILRVLNQVPCLLWHVESGLFC
jgi:ankyrin repeat protein